jgi:hypothetical protein
MAQSSYPTRDVGVEDPDELEGTNVDWEPKFLENNVCVGELEGSAGRGLEFECTGILTLEAEYNVA